LINADKTWSTRVDISHLQPYLQPGMPTRFSLANVLSNTYNVPIWARARVHVYFKTPLPASTNPTTSRAFTPHSHRQHVVKRALLGSEVVEAAGMLFPMSMSSALSVPSEVIPLVPSGQPGMEALTVIGGNGDRYAHVEHWFDALHD
jgi:hypothetical protein